MTQSNPQDRWRTSLQAWVGLSPAPPTLMDFLPPQPPLIRGDRLQILNWNIAKNNHTDRWQREMQAIVQAHNPHLLFFQETRIDLTAPHLPWCLGWHFAANVVSGGQGFGVLTGSRLLLPDPPAYGLRHGLSPTSGQARVLHSLHYEPLLATPKVALINEYPIEDRAETLLTINVHGLNFVRSHKFAAQLAQIEAAIAPHPGPIILAGDFNTWRPKRMALLQTSVGRLGLTAVTFAPTCQRNLKRFLRSDPLDHVFYRGLAVTHCQVLETEASDHRPMLIGFKPDWP